MRMMFPLRFTRCWNRVAMLTMLCFALYTTTVTAQNILTEKNALSIVAKHSSELQLSKNQLAEVIVSSTYHDKLLNADLVYLQQTINGIPVINTIKTIAFKNDKVMSVSGKYVSVANGMAQKNSTPSVKASDAVIAAAKDVNLVTTGNAIAQKTTNNGRKVEFGKLGISQSNMTAELMWQPTDNNNNIKLVWQVKLVPQKSSDYWLIQVDAHTGMALNKMNLTVYCNWDKEKAGEHNFVADNNKFQPDNFLAPPPVSINNSNYLVIPYPAESPTHTGGTQANVANPWLRAGAGNNATTLGWQNDGTTEYTITRGNNVWAKEDRAGDNETTIGISADNNSLNSDYAFNYPLDFSSQPTTTINQKAAITNLFYWNNTVHDIIYQYGFDEASGNFQNDNQGRGGTGGDFVMADAQDGIGSNNANFSTPVDGFNGRMQMFLFNGIGNPLTVNAPDSLAGSKTSTESGFSINNKLANVGPVTGSVVLYDPSDPNSQACTALPGTSLTGKIAILYRGTCSFTSKVKNAQNAGAIAVIVVNSTTGVFGTMGGTDNTITIPAVLMTNPEGTRLVNAIAGGTPITATLKATIQLDGDLDNGVITHEYGHGISNRLTGGPANSSCLQNKEQMGEGWSDYYALMVTTNWAAATTSDGLNKRPIGTYVLGQASTGGGFRKYPYTTDMSINPWTYGMLATNTTNANTGLPGEPHLVGESWAATLWDMTWNIITQQSSIGINLYDASATGGNNIAMKLVTQGLKLQPCSPGFLDGRNAILKADTMLYGGKYSCAIWRAFARRGMGKNAVQGSSNDVTDQTEDFVVPAGMSYDTLTVCDSLVWNGTTYKSSGDYTFTTTGQGGCDSIANLHLTVNHASGSDTTASVCNSFTWHGVTYFNTGDKTFKTTNAAGCDSIITLHLTILFVPNTATKTDPTCYGSTNGSITINATGGTGPYTYRLGTTGSINSSTNIFPNLKAGSYRVYVQDATGCIGVSVVVIPQPAKTTATVTPTPVTGCFGGSNGKITISNPVGTPAFKYKLGSGGTYTNLSAPLDITGLKAGNYSVYIKDANGCEGPAPVATVSQPPKISATFTITPMTCNGSNDGKITISNLMGTGPFMYKTSSGGIYTAFTAPFDITGLRAGNYVIYLQDANGCSSTSAVLSITQPTPPNGTFTSIPATCFGSATGTIRVNGFNGSSPYMYKLGASGVYGTSNTFNNLKAGTYRVYIQDSHGCIGAVNVTVAQPTAVTVGFTKVDETCPTSLDGSITASASGSTPFQYKLNTTGTYSYNNVFSGLSGSTYRVFVLDASGCQGASPVITINVITDPCPPPNPLTVMAKKTAVAAKSLTLSLSLSPNPSNNQFKLIAHSSNTKPVTIRVIDVNGRSLYQAKGQPDQSFWFGEKLPHGLYMIEVKQGDETKTLKAVKE